MSELILASASPRRLDLLKQIHITPDHVIAADVDETPYVREHPVHYVRRVSMAKVASVAKDHPDAFILGADTVVVSGRHILPKAEDDDQVKWCLRHLSGRRHRVLTSVVLHDPKQRLTERMVSSVVSFKRIEPLELNQYIQSQEGIGKAGGYAIQRLAGGFVKHLNGSYSSVVGLPLYETRSLLIGAGYV